MHKRKEEGTMKTISVPTELAAAILRTKTALPANLYFIARFYDKTGSGKAKLSDCKNLLRVAGRSFNIVDSVLRSDEFNLFFKAYDKNTDMLYYHSLGIVAANLNTSTSSSKIANVDILAISKSKLYFSAFMYATYVSGISGPISRDTISNNTNASRQAQRTWEKKANVIVQPHFIEGTPEQLRPLLKKDSKGNYLFCTSKESDPGTILVQTCNTYATKLTVKNRSYLARKMNRSITANTLDFNGRQGTFSEIRNEKFFYTEDEILSQKKTVNKFYIEQPYDSATFYAMNGDLDIDLDLRSDMGLGTQKKFFTVASIRASWKQTGLITVNLLGMSPFTFQMPKGQKINMTDVRSYVMNVVEQSPATFDLYHSGKLNSDSFFVC